MTTSPTPGSDPAARINQLVLDIWLATERNGPRYDDFDLTGQQHAALGLVVAHPGITPTRLADELGVTKGAVSHHLAALEKAGYLTRRRSDDDGRVQVLDLAKREGVALTVGGPEQPLVAGVVDMFRGAGHRVFGPTAAAAPQRPNCAPA